MSIELMIDIETMATTVDAYILQIAAVPFDMSTGQIGDEASRFNRHLRAKGQEDRRTDLDTFVWWMDQPKEAQQAVFRPRNRFDIRQVLSELATFYVNLGHPVIWSNGPEFDSAILKHAYEQNDIPCPWHHRKVRDLRTAKDLLPVSIHRPEPDTTPVFHDPEVDCIEQIRDLAWATNGSEMRRTARMV